MNMLMVLEMQPEAGFALNLPQVQMWKIPGTGSLTFSDGMLYLLTRNVLMKLIKWLHDKFEKMGEFKVPKRGMGSYWTHPVVCGGLYLRHADKLFAYISSK